MKMRKRRRMAQFLFVSIEIRSQFLSVWIAFLRWLRGLCDGCIQWWCNRINTRMCLELGWKSANSTTIYSQTQMQILTKSITFYIQHTITDPSHSQKSTERITFCIKSSVMNENGWSNIKITSLECICFKISI